MLEQPLTEDEAQHCIELKHEALESVKSKTKARMFRRTIRNRLHRIRQGRKEFDNGLKKLIEAQFKPPMTWDSFTFEWDVSPIDPLKVVTPYEWKSEGGKFEKIMVPCDDGITREQLICKPTAFTKQEL